MGLGEESAGISVQIAFPLPMFSASSDPFPPLPYYPLNFPFSPSFSPPANNNFPLPFRQCETEKSQSISEKPKNKSIIRWEKVEFGTQLSIFNISFRFCSPSSFQFSFNIFPNSTTKLVKLTNFKYFFKNINLFLRQWPNPTLAIPVGTPFFCR